ncbi:MAG: hypothetical protein FJ009_15500 [Chloroflexi bacterium]|nr:hypothetical protein [Chloroflexota bacterium]
MNKKIILHSIRLLIPIFLLSSLLSSSARADAPAFQTYTQRDGLAADYVTGIAFAPDGAAWLGTTRGACAVARYQDFVYNTRSRMNEVTQ